MEQVYKLWKYKNLLVVLEYLRLYILMLVICCYLEKKITNFWNFKWIIPATLK